MIPSGGTFGGKHTLTDFGMYPKSKIIFAPPSPKTNYIDIPISNGSLDYTELIDGKVFYENRKGSIEFLVLTGNTYATIYSQVLAHFHGQVMNVVLDDDPDYFYKGRFSVNTWHSKEGASSIVLDYNLDPYKYSVDSTGEIDWLWDDLFDTIIYYGTFSVSGSKARNLINPSSVDVTPKFICSSLIYVDFNNVTYVLPAGETDMPGFSLAYGDNNMTFRGNSNVIVDYIMGVLL